GVTTVMGNIVLAAREPGSPLPRGLHRGRTTRPYISAGIGAIREDTTIPSRRRTDLGTDIGVGVLAMGGGAMGIRGDVRYFRDLVGNSSSGNIDFGDFHFWRGSLTVVFRF